MSVSAVGSQSAIAIKQLVAMRAQFDDLQRQLSTGQKSANYAGLGLNRGVTVSLNAQLSALGGSDNTISNVSTRISLMNPALGRMSDIGSAVKAAMVQANTTGTSSGSNVAKQTALSSLDEILGLLNTKAGDHYLFSGRATDQPAVDTMDHILNGNGAQAGLALLHMQEHLPVAQADVDGDDQPPDDQGHSGHRQGQGRTLYGSRQLQFARCVDETQCSHRDVRRGRNGQPHDRRREGDRDGDPDAGEEADVPGVE